ncbi:trihelix transcription factor gt-3a-like: PROVISIONAL [Gigaspora margarita]|uniref:Trihelix transcription factor gt-3a-like: PROVISIONAL n=1 Tax=Gigaspora margarita TaxID=4874 RepID=A0A8H3XM68_GIGMA|nr:trihelix transcription factor gt-3a-like: PROVISIONAL [Gigaspora margarita]
MNSLMLNKTLFLPPSFTTSRDQENLSPFGPIAIDVESSTSSTSSNVLSLVVTSGKSSNWWTSSETQMLIEEVGKQQNALQWAKDPREKGQIWDKIIANVHSSEIASIVLKECTKTSIQQKWDSLLQKYRDIKDKISSTSEEAI